MKTITTFGVSLVLITTVLLWTKSAQGNDELTSTASDFTLADTHGSTHRLSDYRGKYVVLEWLNYDCPFVRKHYSTGNMQRLQREYTEKGVVWLSIVSSAPGKQGYFSPEVMNQMNEDRGGAPTAILLDSDGKVGRLYGAKTTPHMFVIDTSGSTIYEGAIDDIRSANVDDIQRATNFVAQALDQAMSGQPVTVPSRQPYGCSVKY